MIFYRLRFLILLCFVFFLVPVLSQEITDLGIEKPVSLSKKKIIILNSDETVVRYSQIESAYRKTLKSGISTLNLNQAHYSKKHLTKSLYKDNPDLILCIGSRAYHQAIQAVGTDYPLVFVAVLNAHRFPQRANYYGVANELPVAMPLLLYTYFLPTIKKIGVLYNKEYNSEWIAALKASAQLNDIEILPLEVSHTSQIHARVEPALKKIDALWISTDPIILHSKTQIDGLFQLADTVHMPILSYHSGLARKGAVLTISAEYSTMGYQAAQLSIDLLGRKHIPEPIVNSIGSHIVLNMEKIKQYQLKLNLDALDSVNEIIFPQE